MTVCVCFPHDETQRTHKRGKSNNDYPFHYTFSNSSMRRYATIYEDHNTRDDKRCNQSCSNHDRTCRCIVLREPRYERSVKSHGDCKSDL